MSAQFVRFYTICFFAMVVLFVVSWEIKSIVSGIAWLSLILWSPVILPVLYFIGFVFACAIWVTLQTLLRLVVHNPRIRSIVVSIPSLCGAIWGWWVLMRILESAPSPSEVARMWEAGELLFWIAVAVGPFTAGIVGSDD
ncbi:MAG: hypothetical protein AAF557_15885 [Pseudomonadota bacterium]